VVGAGLAAAQQTRVLVPAGVWQRTRPGAEDALVDCLVSPGFDFDDFELADGV
jgi:predicted cupin superfamily sugar epimerase